MQKLAERNLTKVISRLRQPVLGICLGMQLFARYSAEQDTRCLGIVPAKVRKLQLSPTTPVPNIGWCRIHFKKHHELFAGIDDGSYFYFVHGYALATGNFTIATADHSAPFTAVLACSNFYATQFHPERSAQAGATFLENFLRIST
jgi:imidazole glycerol-phosphate synthase subunit HisH